MLNKKKENGINPLKLSSGEPESYMFGHKDVTGRATDAKSD